MNAVIKFFRGNTLGILLCIAVAMVATVIGEFIPMHLVSGGVIALLIGLLLNPLVKKAPILQGGFNFSSKRLLKLAIIIIGITLSIEQILKVGGYSLVVMTFTLIAAFGFGWLFGKIFKMDWKLSSLISAGTGICGGSAIAAISPVIKAKDSDLTYAIAATFIFDIVMVILFPIVGKAIGMTDLGYGLWAGTAVNDTSSVVAAGFAFSDAAGNFAIIVKLTRTLSIVPVVLIFSLINSYLEKKAALKEPLAFNKNCDNICVIATAPNSFCDSVAAAELSTESTIAAVKDGIEAVNDVALTPSEANISFQAAKTAKKPLYLLKIFPWFILGFVAMVIVKTIGFVPAYVEQTVASFGKFFMVMALAAIGMKTNLKELKTSGFKPMLHGFIISLLVVLVSFGVQAMLGQI